MVGSPRAAIVADDDEFFHARSPIRLAVWGMAATASIAAVVYIARTDLGTKRFATAIAAIGAPPTRSRSPQRSLPRAFATAEREARRGARNHAGDQCGSRTHPVADHHHEHEMDELTSLGPPHRRGGVGKLNPRPKRKQSRQRAGRVFLR